MKGCKYLCHWSKQQELKYGNLKSINLCSIPFEVHRRLRNAKNTKTRLKTRTGAQEVRYFNHKYY